MMELLNKTYSDEKQLSDAFASLEKNKLLVAQMEKLNTISPSESGSKITNIDAIEDISQTFYTNEKVLNTFIDKREITIGGIKCKINSYGSWQPYLPFRIILEGNGFPSMMRRNRYLMRNNDPTMAVEDYGYLYVFSGSVINDTYINLILGILSDRHGSNENFIKNYLTFFVGGTGYQIKESYDLTLREFIDSIETLTIDHINSIIKDVLRSLIIFQSDEYLFVHGNLTLDNVFVRGTLSNFGLKIGNFENSSIFYNGIRFCNEKVMNTKRIYIAGFINYKIDEEPDSYIPIYPSYDVYVFLVSLLVHPKIYQYFQVHPKDFSDIWGDLISDADRLFTDASNKNTIIDLIKGQRFKININNFYQRFINANPSMFGVETEVPYRMYPNRYFLLTTNAASKDDLKLCLDKCVMNTCLTNKFQSSLNSKIYDKASCLLKINAYELAKLKLISKMLYYYNEKGELDGTKLNNDIDWKIFVIMVLDMKLFIPQIGCNDNFIFKGQVLNPGTRSRSVQFVNINVNIYKDLKLRKNESSIESLLEYFSNNVNSRYILNLCVTRFISKIMEYLNKTVFAKINGLTTSGDADPSNIDVKNERSAYLITNKLLYNNNTPNIAAFILDFVCPASLTASSTSKTSSWAASIYDYVIVKQKDPNTTLVENVSLNKYFNNFGPYILNSYDIFLLEMFENGRFLLNFLIELFKGSDNQIYDNFLAIMVQITFTLVCFARIGLIHNDLHLGNMFVQKLGKPTDFYYVLTDASGTITKIINIRTEYLVKIFDFDRSYTFGIKNNPPFDITIPFPNSGYNFTNDKILATRYDFSYICRYIYILLTDFGGYSNGAKPNAIIADAIKLIKETGNTDLTAPVDAKQNQSKEKTIVENSIDPFTWLNQLKPKAPGDVVKMIDKVADIVLSEDSSIYLFPGADLDAVSKEFYQNESWKNKKAYQKLNICSVIVNEIESGEILEQINNLGKRHMGTTQIDWVVNAESCDTFEKNIQEDQNTNPKRRLGFGRIVPEKEIIKGLDPKTLKLMQEGRYEPNLSYIGMQQAVLLKKNFLKEATPKIILSSASTSSIMTALMSTRGENVQIYVVPYISEIQNVGVKSSILKRRIAFMKDWLETYWINDFDDIGVMEDLALVRSELKGDLEVKVTKALTCKPSIGAAPKDTLENKYGRCDTLDLINEIIKTFQAERKFNGKFYQKYAPILRTLKSFLRGPVVNFTFLDKYEEFYNYKLSNKESDAERYDTSRSNIKLFYIEILPLLVSVTTNNKILCFAHEGLIKEIYKMKDPDTFAKEKTQLEHMRNTQVIRETITYDSTTFSTVFIPEFVRTNYENFEDLNLDICREDGIRGVLDSKDLPVAKRSFDVKYNTVNSYKNMASNIVLGGFYKHKYLKYKTKYLGLLKKPLV